MGARLLDEFWFIFESVAVDTPRHRPPIPWPVPALMLVISYWGIFSMYVATFNYLADAYETYSSSAQAAQGFARNTSSGIFPLFAYQMVSSTRATAVADV